MNKAFMFVLVVITVAVVFWGIKTHLYNEGEVVNEDFEITGEIKKLDISEDDIKSGQEDVQELINKYNKIVDEKFKEKENELMSL